MKTKRFFSVFLLVALLMSIWAVPFAFADETVAPVEDPDIQAAGALLMDAHTGAVVYAKGEHRELYPASLTKIMTFYLVLEAIEAGKLTMDQELTVTASALEGLSSDGSSANIKEGEIMSVKNLIYCMMVVSANEACNILAEAVSGSVSAFVDAMNAKAKSLGCENTHFVNTNGLHDPAHYTSAWDLYLITKAAMKYDDFMTICDTADVVIPATNLSSERHLYTTNYLISTWRSRGYINPDARGIKTGSTSEAGYCLVSSATRGSLSFISVVLGAERNTLEDGTILTYSFYETNRLFNWGFENFGYRTIVEAKDPVSKEASVTLSKIEHVTLVPAKDIEVLMPNDLQPEDLERDIRIYVDPVEAPISEGDVLGSMTLSYEGKEYATVDLLANNDVEASKLLVFWRDVQLFFSRTAVKVAIAVLVVLIVALIVWRVLFSRRRYRYGRSVSYTQRRNYRGRRR